MKGFTTIHSGSARQALTRLRFITQLADAASQLPLSALNTLVSESIDIVVHCGRTPRGPRVTEVIAVEDQAGGPDSVTSAARAPGRCDAAMNRVVLGGRSCAKSSPNHAGSM